MKLQSVVRWSIVFTALTAPVSGAAYNIGADQDYSYLALKGVRAMTVRFQGFYGDFERYGVEETRLRETVERRLRDSGLSVLNAGEAIRDPGAALMHVNMHVNYSTYGYYSYAVSMKIKQKIALAGGPESFVTETVWSRGTGGLVDPLELRRVNGEIAGLVEQFLAEHRAQNSAASTAAIAHPPMH